MAGREHLATDLVALLADASVPPDDALPHRGRPIETERQVAPCFINGKEYGTRASTIMYMSATDIRFVEQTYYALGERGGQVSYEFKIGETR